MPSKQLKLMNDLYTSIKERVSKPGLDLATNRDIVENLHLAASEPEAVSYAEPGRKDDPPHKRVFFEVFSYGSTFPLEQDYTKQMFAGLEGKLVGAPIMTNLNAL
jgi:hypothetical protein